MTSNLFRSAERKKAKLRLALCGAAGAGKTMSALLIAKGLGDKIAVIDTERGSSELYSDVVDFDVCVIEPPFKVEKYIDAITAAGDSGYEVIVIDSISHAWSGEGGLLDQHTAIANRTNNKYTSWGAVTPLHYRFIDSMLQSPSHIIATMRSKIEYAMEKDEKTGKVSIKKLGMAPVQRSGLEYEFTLVLDMDQDHMSVASKDRTSMFTDMNFRPSVETGRKLKKWLEMGKDEDGQRDKPLDVSAPEEKEIQFVKKVSPDW